MRAYEYKLLAGGTTMVTTVHDDYECAGSMWPDKILVGELVPIEDGGWVREIANPLSRARSRTREELLAKVVKQLLGRA